jgi:PAS domain S-box-containing protein
MDLSTSFNNANDTSQLQLNPFDNLPVAIYTCNNVGYIESYNPAAVRLWGREPEAGRELWCGSWKIFKTNGAPMLLAECPMARTLREGLAIDGEEIIIKRPDGTYRNVLAYPVPNFDDSGKLAGATNTLIDITEHKSDENKQAMLAAIIESSDDAIISKTLEGIITSWNKSAERLFGYKESEAIGKHVTMLIPPDQLSEEDMIIGKIRKSEKIDHFETIRVTKAGLKIPISLTVSPIRNNKGAVIGASKIVRDISRQKTAETDLQRYAESLEILNSISQAISAELNVEGILQKVTDATTKLSGAAFGAFFHNLVNETGESYTLYSLSGAPKEAFEKFGMPRNTDVFAQTFHGKGILRSDDITKDPRFGHNPPHYGMPKGHPPVASYLAVPVVSKSGAVIGGLFYGHPEAAKFNAEHEEIVAAIAVQAAIALDNAKLYEEIKMLNAKKDEFIGLASHELKTPVTSINGYLQIIERDLPGEDRNKKFVTKARQQVGKLNALIADLLDVSKIQTGQLPLTYSSFNLVALLTEVTEIMQQNNADYTIGLHCKEDTIFIRADQQRIEQVIINLISNAIKYSPGTDRIEINAEVAGHIAKVSVQDFGLGIAKDQQERIFSRFYRVDNIATHISGLGIGLYISQEIINRHNGKLWVESAPGKGSTFFFELPMYK